MFHYNKPATATGPIECLIDSHECAKRLGLHKTTLVNKTRQGLIPSYRIPTDLAGSDGEYRYMWSEVLAGLKSTITTTGATDESSK